MKEKPKRNKIFGFSFWKGEHGQAKRSRKPLPDEGYEFKSRPFRHRF
jgi:hypothetical protein